MKKSVEELLNDIKVNVQKGLKDVMRNLGIDLSKPESKEKHAEILLSGWQTVKEKFMKKWIPAMTEEEADEVVSWLKKEKSMHSIKNYVKHEYKENIIQSLGSDKYNFSEIDPDVFSKIDTLSFGANIAYNTILSMINEHLEILLAEPFEDEAGIREKAEDLWLIEVYERVMIEYIQYGTDVVNELDDYAKSIDFFDGFTKDLIHDIYNKLVNNKLNEIKKIRDIYNI